MHEHNETHKHLEHNCNENHNHHEHNHKHDIKDKNIFITIMLNLVITIAEFVGGFLSNSLALISDAFHNLSDVTAIILTYFALKISKKSKTSTKTFGYKRIEVISAFINSIALVVISLFLFKEAIERFIHYEKIDSMVMFTVAIIGFFANLISVFLLKSHTHGNLNIKSAYLHLLGDTLSSVGVIIGGILIYFFEIYWIDPVVTILIGLFILKEAVKIVKESYGILMNFAPKGIKTEEIKEDIEKFEEVKNVHHVHLWLLNDEDIYFECHVELKNDLKLSETNEIKEKIHELLEHEFKINHITLQMGYNCCSEMNLLC